MKILQPALNQPSRTFLKDSLDKYFEFNKHGEDLNSVIKEILNDRDLFTYLVINLPENHGLYLGSVGYYDDIQARVDYGLTICSEIPRKINLFAIDTIYPFNSRNLSGNEVTLWNLFPDHLIPYERYKRNIPSVEEFVKQVNESLKNIPNSYALLR